MNVTLRLVHCFNSDMLKIGEMIKMLPVGGDRKIVAALTRLCCQGRQFSVTKGGGEIGNMDERRGEKRRATCSRCCLSYRISFKHAFWCLDTKFEL